MMNVQTHALVASSAARRKINFKMSNIAGKYNLSGKPIWFYLGNFISENDKIRFYTS
jgi:hypothetical protein